METIISKNKCTACSACYNICPKQAISMQSDEKGFKYPVINQEKCIDCGMCKRTCPVINTTTCEKQITVYACYNKNEEERLSSSSGGIFILLAKEIINRGGAVFGASFDENFRVIHSYAESIIDLKKFMGSKYVQSDLGDTYKQVKDFLNNDRYVLFSGTPCQVEGLNSFLGKDYEKLYTQDLICHGVPSPEVWEKYKEYRKMTDKSTPDQISFRNKDNGWKLFNMKFYYKDTEYKNSLKDDYYMKAFLKNTSLRDSCYNCNFKKKYRDSDITLADFWGINNVFPGFDKDDKGISLLLVNSDKGKELFDTVKNEMIYEETDFEESVKYNSAYIKSVVADKNRDEFFKHIDNLQFDKLVKKYTYSVPIYKRVYKKIRNMCSKLLRKK